jgi:hypothetical protein
MFVRDMLHPNARNGASFSRVTIGEDWRQAATAYRGDKMKKAPCGPRGGRSPLQRCPCAKHVPRQDISQDFPAAD